MGRRKNKQNSNILKEIKVATAAIVEQPQEKKETIVKTVEKEKTCKRYFEDSIKKVI